MRLTEREIEKLVCPAGKRDQLVFDDTQRGLAVRVTASGGKTYLAQYTISGQKRRVPLGSCSAISLARARQACEAVMGARASGIDTAVERSAKAEARRIVAERERLTLATLVETWRDLHLSQRRPRYAKEAVRALHHAFHRQWNKPAEALDRAAVVRALDEMARAGHPSIASRTAAYGRACFQWAVKRGTFTNNPFAALPVMGTKPKRERVLADDELAAIWRAASAMSLPFGPIVRLLMLTGQRREEVAGMTWAEFSGDLSTWTIAAIRTKNGQPHVVPLAEPARQLLRSLPRVDDLVMPGDRPPAPFSGWSKGKARLDAASRIGDWVLHDLRRSMATGLQRLGVRLEVTEAVLNHISGSRAGIVGIYQRHDWAAEKRAALDSWAHHILAITSGAKTTGNLVHLARRWKTQRLGAFIGPVLSNDVRAALAKTMQGILRGSTEQQQQFLNIVEEEVDCYRKLTVPVKRALDLVPNQLERIADTGNAFAAAIDALEKGGQSILLQLLSVEEGDYVPNFEHILAAARWARLSAKAAERHLQRRRSKGPGPTPGGDRAVVSLVRNVARQYTIIFGKQPSPAREGIFARALSEILNACDVRDPDDESCSLQIGETRLRGILQAPVRPRLVK